jgi:endonuclease/exonuclease/phosphatase (EEP) superfamily protein YafD
MAKARTGTSICHGWLLAGDLNATPDSEVIDALAARWTNASVLDAPPSDSTASPRARINYVLVRPAHHWRVIESRLLGDTVASDHRPLFVALEWTERM